MLQRLPPICPIVHRSTMARKPLVDADQIMSSAESIGPDRESPMPDRGHTQQSHDCTEHATKVMYGFPGPEAIEAYERGEIELGGCMVREDSFDYRCRVCGRSWFEDDD